MRSGYCSPPCFPSYGTGHSGYSGVAHRLISGRAGGGGAPPAANPWWDPGGEGLCIWAAYQPKGAADLAASYLDLSGNGNNTGPGVAPTWDIVNGWKFDGINDYLTTTFVPQNDQSQSALIQFTNLGVAQNRYLWGARTGGHYFLSANWAADPSHRYADGVITAGISGTYGAGNAAVAGNQGYRDGVADSPALANNVTVPTTNVLIGAINWVGTPSGFCQMYVQAFVLYYCALTAPQVLSVATAMAAL